MNNHQSRLQSTPDQLAISDLIERWSKGVRDQDRVAIRQDHDADILMFDVPPPFQSRGIDEYMATWDTFFSFAEKPVRFDFTNIEITAGVEVAFATAVGHCVTIGRDGRREPLDFRLTMGLRKIDGRWHVMHEHHSLPAV
jgi:ketosteroid isomerase-like protein